MGKPPRKKMTVREEANAPLHRNKLSMEVHARIVRLASKGLTLNLICGCIGISDSTIKVWLDKGKAYIDNNDDPKKHRKYGRLYQEWRKTVCRHRAKLVIKLLDDRYRKDWKRLMTILSRYDRDNWGMSQVVEAEIQLVDANEKFL